MRKNRSRIEHQFQCIALPGKRKKSCAERSGVWVFLLSALKNRFDHDLSSSPYRVFAPLLFTAPRPRLHQQHHRALPPRPGDRRGRGHHDRLQIPAAHRPQAQRGAHHVSLAHIFYFFFHKKVMYTKGFRLKGGRKKVKFGNIAHARRQTLMFGSILRQNSFVLPPPASLPPTPSSISTQQPNSPFVLFHERLLLLLLLLLIPFPLPRPKFPPPQASLLPTLSHQSNSPEKKRNNPSEEKSKHPHFTKFFLLSGCS